MRDAHAGQPDRTELGRRCCRGEGAPLRVSAASTRQIKVSCVGAGRRSQGMKEQRIGVGHTKAAADEDDEKEQRPEPRSHQRHDSILGTRVTGVHIN